MAVTTTLSLVTGEIVNYYPGPVALNSIFGWLISGKSILANTPSVYKVMMVNQLNDILTEEEYHQSNQIPFSFANKPLNDDEDPTYQSFCSSLQKINGRYCADLPWRSGLNVTSSNYYLAKKRLSSIISSLKKTNNFDKYNDVIHNYLKKDYIEPCNVNNTGTYLPHHAVIKQERTTTKIRIVFDGSARTNQSLSLNECLYNGPILLNDLAGMLMKFRIGKTAMTGDLEEAFLQVEIQESNRDYLKFIWIENGQEICYRFKCHYKTPL